MGLRFRKSLKIAPGVKLNLNKKSTSVTFGGKGVHHTISSTGKRTSTVGIPGTGLSYSKTSNSKTKKSIPDSDYFFDDLDEDTDYDDDLCDTPTFVNNDNNPKPKKKERVSLFKVAGCLTQIIILVLLICTFSWVISFFNSLKDAPENIPEDDVPAISESTDFQQAPETTPMYATSEVNIRSGAGTENEILGTLAPSEEVAVISSENGWTKILYNDVEAYVFSDYLSESQPDVTTQTAQNNDDPIVYITNTGKKYHTGTCRTLKDSKIEKHLSEVAGSYEPCKVCSPPR